MLLSIYEFVNVDTGNATFLLWACMKLHDINDFCVIYSPCTNTIFRVHFWRLCSEQNFPSDCVLLISSAATKIMNSKIISKTWWVADE